MQGAQSALPEFRPGWSGARGLLASLLLQAALAVCTALLFTFLALAGAGAAPGQSVDVLQAAAEALLGLAGLLCAVAWVLGLVWVYRANLNCSKLGSDYMVFTPGWAVNWFFVPLLCYWKVPQVIGDIWRQSQPRDAGAVPARASSAWIGWCWAGLLLFGIAGRLGIAAVTPDAVPSVYSYAGAYGMLTLFSLGLALSALLAAYAVHRIDRQQNRSFALGRRPPGADDA